MPGGSARPGVQDLGSWRPRRSDLGGQTNVHPGGSHRGDCASSGRLALSGNLLGCCILQRVWRGRA